MTIKPGDKIPSVKLKRLGKDGLEDVDMASYVKDKKVVIFAVPGAFTPTCTQKHLPSYIDNADKIKAEGIDEIICIAVNDPFVMKHWGQGAGADGKITMMPDWNAAFTKAVGLEMDGSGFGLGTRSKRYSMLVDKGVVKSLDVEAEAGKVTSSGGEACLARLAG
jgi:glutaredoxin/glutathione-dependent peroxiredoxin